MISGEDLIRKIEQGKAIKGSARDEINHFGGLIKVNKTPGSCYRPYTVLSDETQSKLDIEPEIDD